MATTNTVDLAAPRLAPAIVARLNLFTTFRAVTRVNGITFRSENIDRAEVERILLNQDLPGLKAIEGQESPAVTLGGGTADEWKLV